LLLFVPLKIWTNSWTHRHVLIKVSLAPCCTTMLPMPAAAEPATTHSPQTTMPPPPFHFSFFTTTRRPIPPNERLGPDLPRGRDKMIGGDLNIDNKGSE
jgi:hypothetical protein